MIFTRYRNEEKKRNQLFNLEWSSYGSKLGGFFLLSRTGVTMLHRFAAKGSALLGTEEEFVARWQTVLEREPRFSWFTFEFFNWYEARLFYIVVKIWQGVSIKLVANLGWRLTRASRDFLERQAIEAERGRVKRIMQEAKTVKQGMDGVLRGVKEVR